MAVAGQMNIRMDTTLKAQGDAVLAAAGFSPSQAVRALWELALRYKDAPSKVADVLEPDRVSDEVAILEAGRAHKLALIKENQLKSEAFYKQFGLVPDPHSELATLSYKQLRELAYLDEQNDEFGLTDDELLELVQNED